MRRGTSHAAGLVAESRTSRQTRGSSGCPTTGLRRKMDRAIGARRRLPADTAGISGPRMIAGELRLPRGPRTRRSPAGSPAHDWPRSGLDRRPIPHRGRIGPRCSDCPSRRQAAAMRSASPLQKPERSAPRRGGRWTRPPRAARACRCVGQQRGMPIRQGPANFSAAAGHRGALVYDRKTERASKLLVVRHRNRSLDELWIGEFHPPQSRRLNPNRAWAAHAGRESAPARAVSEFQ